MSNSTYCYIRPRWSVDSVHVFTELRAMTIMVFIVVCYKEVCMDHFMLLNVLRSDDNPKEIWYKISSKVLTNVC